MRLRGGTPPQSTKGITIVSNPSRVKMTHQVLGKVVSQLRISGEFIKESCVRHTAAPQGMRSTDPRPLGIGGP